MRYDVGVSINGGHIMWINGPFRPGEFNNLQILCQNLRNELEENEKVCADDGYGDRKWLRKCHIEKSEKQFFARIFSRHESVNGMLKRFRVFTVPFRHKLYKHKVCFYEIANICQALILYGEPLFSL